MKPYPIIEEKIRLNPECGRENPSAAGLTADPYGKETWFGVFKPNPSLMSPEKIWRGKIIVGLYRSRNAATAERKRLAAAADKLVGDQIYSVFTTTDPELKLAWLNAALVGQVPNDLSVTRTNPQMVVKSRRKLRAARTTKAAKPAATIETEIHDDEENEPCPVCGGPGMQMGGLGRLTWHRCRDCGMQFSTEAPRRNPAPAAEIKTEVSALGRCVELTYRDFSDGKNWKLRFPEPGRNEVVLAQTARKRLCFFYRPRIAKVSPASFDQVHLANYREFNGKDVDKVFNGIVPVFFCGSRRVGELREIIYWSDKVIDPESAKEPANYQHHFKAPYPVLYTNPRNQLVVDGGGYHINRRGIIN